MSEVRVFQVVHACNVCRYATGPDFSTVKNSIVGASYLVTLYTHIGYVREAGKKLGVPEALLIAHDATKASVSEIGPYSKHFQGGGAPKEFPYAWMHHISHNPHHWQHWLFPDSWSLRDSDVVGGALPMPECFALEMVADWMGSSKAYTGDWDMSDWLSGNIPRIRLHPETALFVGDVLRSLGYGQILDKVRFAGGVEPAATG